MSTDTTADNAATIAPATTEAAPSTETTAPAQVPASDSTTSWLPSEYRDNPSFKDFTGPDSVYKSYDHLKKLEGSSIRIPGKDAGKEDMDKFFSRVQEIPGVMRSPDYENSEAMAQFYNKLGRPDEASGYEVKLGEGEALDTNHIENAKKSAHEAGLTTKQFQKMVEFDLARLKTQKDLDTHNAQIGIKKLKDNWGSEFDNRINGAQHALMAYDKQYKEGVADLKIVAKNNPALVAMLADLGRSMHEKGTISAVGAFEGTTKDEALAQISEIRNNKAHAYHNRKDIAYDMSKKKMDDLYAIVYPESQG